MCLIRLAKCRAIRWNIETYFRNETRTILFKLKINLY